MAKSVNKFACAAGACVYTIVAATSASYADAGDRNEHKTAVVSNPYGKPGNPSAVRKFVFLNATDMKFSKKTLKFRRGQTVKFILRNKGEQDHEMTLGDAATQAAHRREMAKAVEKGKDLGHHGHENPNAIFVKPGASKTLIWEFSKAGVFEFACNIPGHAEAGMKGTIIVTQ